MKVRYYVYGLGYDENDCVIDFELEFGDFDTYKEAHGLFDKLQNKEDSFFFKNNQDIYQLDIVIEECEENNGQINCIDIKDEFWVLNPKFKQ